MKKTIKPLNFKTFKMNNSSWISNFWYFGNKLFLTESLFDHEQNFLGYLTAESLENNLDLGFKKDAFEFINHPNPLINSALEASLSEIKTLTYLEEFIYQVFEFNQKIYVALINQDKVHGFTKVYNQNLDELEVISNFLIFGKLKGELLFIDPVNREFFFYQNQQFEKANLPKLKKILNFKTFDVILTTSNQIYLVDEYQIKILIYEGESELEIAKLNEEVIIISDKEKQETFSLALLNKKAKPNLIINEYFFHLDVVNNKILVGKPLFLNHRYEDYSLPLTFIL